MHKLSRWIMAVRPKTLWVGVSPVILAAGFSYQSTNLNRLMYWLMVLLALIGSVSLQIVSNLANDYIDFIKGVDNETRLGPKRVTQSGLVSLTEIKIAILIMASFSMFIGILLSVQGGFPILLITIGSILCAYLYTGGPYPLGYNGLGDVFAFIFFGPVAVFGVVYLLHVGEFAKVLGGRLGFLALIPGLFSACIISVNNLRDRYGDRQSGKRTLAVLFGDKFVRWEYLILTLSIYSAILLNIYYFGVTFNSLASFLIFPFSFKLIRDNFIKDGVELNGVLVGTAKSMILFSCIYSLTFNF